jgi:hypothetical protein
MFPLAVILPVDESENDPPTTMCMIPPPGEPDEKKPVLPPDPIVEGHISSP